MCGIAGIVDFKKNTTLDANLAQKIVKTLKHRGPDDDDYWFDETALFIHTRLSIIDLSESGRQPMLNADQNVVCTFNGEIYNFQILKDELIKRGHTFKGTSDAEILPYMYQEYGTGMLDLLEGMFAFAIYDMVNQKIFVARDRLGIKPFYYHHNPEKGLFYFGSELKAILVHEEVEKKVDHQAIYDYLGFNVVPEPATGFDGIYALEVAHCMEIDASGITTRKYWDVDAIEPIDNDFTQAKAELKGHVKYAVESQLMSDAPIGSFLSGGIDSSMVVANASRVVENFPTFTVKFPDAKFDESINAREVADYCKTDHHELVLEESSGDPRLIQELIDHFDQPYADTSSIPTYLITKRMRESIKVALSGDGGDEILAGYHTFWFYRNIKSVSKVPNFLLKIFSVLTKPLGMVKPDLARKLNKVFTLAQMSNARILEGLMCYCWDEEKDAFINSEGFKNMKPTSRIFGNLNKLPSSAKWDDYLLALSKTLLRVTLPSDMLKKVDMMSMKAGIEVRVPLLDEKVVEYSLGIKPEHKISKSRGKLALREVLKEFIPERMVERPKQGFGIPLDKFASPELVQYLKDMLLKPDSRTQKLIKPAVMTEWISGFEGKSNIKNKVSRINLYHRIYAILSVEIWLRKFNLSL